MDDLERMIDALLAGDADVTRRAIDQYRAWDAGMGDAAGLAEGEEPVLLLVARELGIGETELVEAMLADLT